MFDGLMISKIALVLFCTGVAICDGSNCAFPEKLSYVNASSDVVLVYGAYRHFISLTLPGMFEPLDQRIESFPFGYDKMTGLFYFFPLIVDRSVVYPEYSSLTDLIATMFDRKVVFLLRHAKRFDPKEERVDRYGIPLLTKVFITERPVLIIEFIQRTRVGGSMHFEDYRQYSHEALFISVADVAYYTTYHLTYNEELGLHGREPYSSTIDVFAHEEVERVTMKNIPQNFSEADDACLWNCNHLTCSASNAIGKDWQDLFSGALPDFARCAEYYTQFLFSLRVLRFRNQKGKKALAKAVQRIIDLKENLPEADALDAEISGDIMEGVTMVALRKGVLFCFRMDSSVRSLNRMYNLAAAGNDEDDTLMSDGARAFLVDKLDRKRFVAVIVKADGVHYKTYDVPDIMKDPERSAESTVFSWIIDLKEFAYVGDEKLRLSDAKVQFVNLYNNTLHFYCNDGYDRSLHLSKGDVSVSYVKSTRLLVTDSYDGKLRSAEWIRDEKDDRTLQQYSIYSVKKSFRGLHLDIGRSSLRMLTSQNDYDAAVFLNRNRYVHVNGTRVFYGLKGCILFITFSLHEVFRLDGENESCLDGDMDIRVFLAESHIIVISHRTGNGFVNFYIKRAVFKKTGSVYIKLTKADLTNNRNSLNIINELDARACYVRKNFVECLTNMVVSRNDDGDLYIIANFSSVNILTRFTSKRGTTTFTGYPSDIKTLLNYYLLRSLIIVKGKHLLVSFEDGTSYSPNEVLTNSHETTRNMLPCVGKWQSDVDITSWTDETIIFRNNFKNGTVVHWKCVRNGDGYEKWSIKMSVDVTYLAAGVFHIDLYNELEKWLENYTEAHYHNATPADVEDEPLDDAVLHGSQRIVDTGFVLASELTEHIQCADSTLKTVFHVLLTIAVTEVLAFFVVVAIKMLCIDKRVKRERVQAAALQTLVENERIKLAELKRKMQQKEKEAKSENSDRSSSSDSSSSGSSESETDLRSNVTATGANKSPAGKSAYGAADVSKNCQPSNDGGRRRSRGKFRP